MSLRKSNLKLAHVLSITVDETHDYNLQAIDQMVTMLAETHPSLVLADLDLLEPWVDY